MSTNQQPLLAKTKAKRNQYNPGGIDCSCCNSCRSSKHGSKAARRGRQVQKQELRRREERLWRSQEDLP